MRSKENFTPYISTALGLSLAILITFQVYIFLEPARIAADKERDYQSAVADGRELFSENCVACHGTNGEGGVGPALNNRSLLGAASDEVLFNLTRTGIPGTIMPAWSQAFGGPFTDDQLTNIVAFIRSWEPTAPDIAPVVSLPNPARGAAIFTQTCFVCHGDNGQGTEYAPAINDPERLAALEDSWYRQTITNGRPAKGMPTWGTILSPEQINDLVALIAEWREGRDVIAEIPYTRYVTNALFAIRQFDREDAEFFLNASLKVAEVSQRSDIQEVIRLVQDNRLFEAEAALISLLPPEQMGMAIFESSCTSCHGPDGTGGLGPNLHVNSFIQTLSDEELIQFILQGRPGTAMNGFDGVLMEDDLVNLVAVLRSWQDQ